MDGQTMTEIVMDVLQCRCCLCPIHAFWQSDIFDDNGKMYIHCIRENCPLYYATRELTAWMVMDLTMWNAEQNPRWKRPSFSFTYPLP